ncbi:MAG TPA: sugar transferase [Gemmatimonadaceae bacterium]|nr:sugar transferase [Gemmatimonadaceae bacterium]
MKRLLDITAALFGLVLLSPLLVILSIAIWLQDYHSPFYIAPRMGRGEKPFRMVKFRSMVIRADKTGVDSTAGDDPRITALGRFIRRFKLDEIPQLWNVLWGQMSLVGPRPNVERETVLYTSEEKRLLSVRPGITDLASIVFADEGEILQGSADPDLRYNQVIRPWKSRLGLLYVDAPSNVLRDLKVILLTVRGALDRSAALEGVYAMAAELGASPELLEIVSRRNPLPVGAPPGASEIVTSRAVVA